MHFLLRCHWLTYSPIQYSWVLLKVLSSPRLKGEGKNMRLFKNIELLGVFSGSTIVTYLLSVGTESIPEILFKILIGVVLTLVLKAGINMIKKRSESKAD